MYTNKHAHNVVSNLKSRGYLLSASFSGPSPEPGLLPTIISLFLSPFRFVKCLPEGYVYMVERREKKREYAPKTALECEGGKPDRTRTIKKSKNE